MMSLQGMYFAWPLAAALVFLPVLAYRFLPPVNVGGGALKLPDAGLLPGLDSGGSRRRLRMLPLLLASLCWLLLIVSAMRPQQLGESVNLPVTGRNMMLAVDLSGSMERPDFVVGNQRVNRLVATKAVAGAFLDRRIGDRLGLILFGEQAYLQAPLTFDRETVKTLLMESSIRLAGERTAIGDAIGLAVKRVRDTDAEASKQVLVLLTDGANTAGNIEPLRAARLAAGSGLKIYTIGIGSMRGSNAGRRGRRSANPSSDLDEATLIEIARLTDGQYFRATDTRSLEQIYQKLDELEPAASDADDLRPTIEYYWVPLTLSLGLALIAVALTLLKRLIAQHLSVGVTKHV